MTYTLTPADIMDLRASVRWHLATATARSVPVLAFIAYCRDDPSAQNAPGYDPDAFAIYAEGHLWAISTRPEVLAACLRAEWAEPGFMRRVMNPAEDCFVASLNPDAAEKERRRRAFELKMAQAYAEEQQREAAKKARHVPAQPALDPTDFQLDLD